MEPLLFFLRCLVAALFFVLGIFLFVTAKKGRLVAYYSVDPYGDCLSEHRKYGQTTFFMAVAAVVVTEGFVRLKGGSQASALLFVHFGLAAPFLATLAYIVFKHTGLRRPKTHKYFAYSCVILYLGTLLTGLSLLFPEVVAEIPTVLGYCWPHKWFPT